MHLGRVKLLRKKCLHRAGSEAPRLVVIVVVLVPIVLGAPAVLVFIPPAMLLAPATLASFVQFATLVIGLPAVAAMFLDGLVEFVVGVSDSTLTAVDVFGVKPRRCAEEKDCAQERA